MTEAESILKTDNVIGPLLERALAGERWDQQPGLSHNRSDWKVEVLKYRPERRLCLRVEVPDQTDPDLNTSFIMKIWYNTRGKRIFRNLASLNAHLANNAGLKVPNPLFYDLEAQALVYPEAKGIPLTSLLREGNSREWIGPVARAFATIHSLQLPGMRSRTAEDELESVEKLLGKDGDSELLHRIEETVSDLARYVPPGKADSLLHRDLYDQQILLTPDSGVFLLDLDDMACGDPMLDIGNFLAHIHLVEYWRSHPNLHLGMEENFLKAYWKQRAGSAEILSALPWYKSVSLCRLAALQGAKGNLSLSRQIITHIRTSEDKGKTPSRR